MLTNKNETISSRTTNKDVLYRRHLEYLILFYLFSIHLEEVALGVEQTIAFGFEQSQAFKRSPIVSTVRRPATRAPVRFAKLKSPENSSTLKSSSVVFEWDLVPGAREYSLSIASDPNNLTFPSSGDIFQGSFSRSQSSVEVSDLPKDGSKLYARLWTNQKGQWAHEDYTFSAYTYGPAKLLSPTQGTIINSSTVSFTWSEVPEATSYKIGVSTDPSLNSGYPYGNIYKTETNSTTVDVSGIPIDGSTVYIRIWTFLENQWQFQDYSYQTKNLMVQAGLVSPAMGAPIESPDITLSWDTPALATSFKIGVSTRPEFNSGYPYGDIYKTETSGNSVDVSGVPVNGNPIFVRVWSFINNQWLFNDYEFPTKNMMTPAELVSPTIATTIDSDSMTFTWNSVQLATSYKIGVSTRPEYNSGYPWGDIFKAETGETSIVVNRLPTDGRPIYVRIWTFVEGQWLWSDYEFNIAP